VELEGFNSVIKNQLSFNKMIETQVAQLASSCPNINAGKLPRQPEVPSKENVSAVTTRSGKSTQEPSVPLDARTRRKTVTASHTEAEEEEQEEAVESNTLATREDTVEPPRTSREYHDTTALLFSEQIRKPVADKQFGKFVEVIKKFHVNIPLLDAMQIPTYTKYIKDILGNTRTLPTTEVVQLTKECNATILDPLPEKKKDPGYPTITCSIRAQYFKHALCNLGASINCDRTARINPAQVR